MTTAKAKHEARKAQQRACAKRQRTLDPARVREVKLLAAYGISATEYDALLAMQSGACAICFRQRDGMDGKPRRLSVDHCHRTKRIRGLLCNNCNRGLGFFGDDPERLARAASYLTRTA